MGDDDHAPDGSSRRAAVAALMALQSISAEPATTVSLLESLCRTAAIYAAAVGATVSLVADGGPAGTVASADELSFRLDELQFSLGEGPTRDASSSRRPILVADLASPEAQQWPVFGAEAMSMGAGGVLTFPLHVGAATFGTLTVYTGPGVRLTSEQLAMLVTFADVATEILLAGESPVADGVLNPSIAEALSYRTEIYQAQGAVMAQLGVTLSEALVRMRAHAFALDLSLAELAERIMSGEVVLGETTDE